jgi:hypothetical protein
LSFGCGIFISVADDVGNILHLIILHPRERVKRRRF